MRFYIVEIAVKRSTSGSIHNNNLQAIQLMDFARYLLGVPKP